MTRTTAIQDGLIDVAALAARDAVPNHDRSVRAVKRAINIAASEHHGLVHASWVRPHLPRGIASPLIGAVFAGLVTDGVLIPSNRAPLPNGGPSGNAAKLSRVWRLVKAFEAEEVAL